MWRSVVTRASSGQLLALGFVVAILAGVANLSRPFFGDQALFVVGARELLDGDALYVDFWDTKQPGIYWWYVAAGRITGFHEAGIHGVELVWQVATALVLVVLVRPHLRQPKLAALLPVTTTGLYYLTARTESLTQVESLMGLPMLVSVWLFQVSEASRRYRGVLLLSAGVAGGCVALLKLIYAPEVAAIWLVLLIFSVRGHPRPLMRFAGAGALLTVGAVLPVVAALLVVGRNGQLGLVLRIWLVVPQEIAALDGLRRVSILFSSTTEFVTAYAPCLLLAVIAIIARLPRRRDPLVFALATWLAAGLGSLLAQVWWEYTFMQLVVPLGALGVIGLDELLTRMEPVHRPRRLPRLPRLLLVAALVLCVGPLFAAGGVWNSQVGSVLKHGIDGPRRYQERFYEASITDLRLLGHPVPAGSMMVLGNPTLLYLADRDQAIAHNGWSPELYTPENCAAVMRELRIVRPKFLFVSKSFALEFHHRCGPSNDPSSGYGVVARTPKGTWFKPDVAAT